MKRDGCRLIDWRHVGCGAARSGRLQVAHNLPVEGGASTRRMSPRGRCFTCSTESGPRKRCTPGGAKPKYPDIRTFPWAADESLSDRLTPGGPVGQLAYRAWVTEVYGKIWEHHYRIEIQTAFERRGAGARNTRGLKHEVLGDLRLIRNDILRAGTARNGNAASCRILRWFQEDEAIRLQFRHILDLLNQMDWLSADPTAAMDPSKLTGSNRWLCLWRDGWAESEPVHGSPPDLVSVRPIAMPDESDWRYRFGVSVAFADGVFGRVPMPTPSPLTEEQAMLRASRWERTAIRDGNLQVPGVARAPSDVLYRNCYEPSHTGPRVCSRAVKID